ncbi:MAG TPA: CvpA family protein [Hyphomicrobiaceae bacterium]|jgi:membrane protein required for colicin V production|nr:CvpA family protein [Hyphomicrobiaceae bacterium]
MIAGISYLDAALVAVVAISGLVAMYRGFTREVLSILSWVAAAVAAFYVIFYQQGFAEELAKQLANPPQQVHLIIARIIIGSAIFLIVLIIVHLITSHISDTVLDSRIGPIDRILGLGFGVVRGFILVVIPYMFAVSFVCKDGATRAIAQGCQPGELPGWIEDARSKNMIKSTGSTLFGVLDRFVPKGISSG